MKYVLEPFLFALDENITEREFKLYVNRLIQWDTWLEKNPEDVYMLSNTRDLLFNMKYIPIYPVFEQLIKKYKINYVQASHLETMINRLLANTKKLDKIEDVKVDDDILSHKLNPKYDSGNAIQADDYQKSLETILWYLYCQCKKLGDNTETYIVFGKNLSTNITLNVEYQTIEEVDGVLKEVMNKESVKVICRSSLAEFFKDSSTSLSILQQTSCKEDISLAIRVAVYQNGNLKKVMDTYDQFDFYLQDSFYRDFCDAHYESQYSFLRSLMEAMSHTLLNMNMGNREDWRKDKGGASGQKRHGDWLAWRRYVTQSVKMMYWQNNDKYRFANVKEHDIFVCQWEN